MDSFPAIAVSVERTLDDLGAPRSSAEDLRAVVGAPLHRVFEHMLGPSRAALIEPAIARYRVHFDDIGMTRIQAFPGIGDALQAFGRAGHAMRVVTARSAPSAARILSRLALDGYFDEVHAPEPAVRVYDKADHVMAALVRACCTAADAIVVGDRADDVRAGLVHGVSGVGVSWGNGTRTELEEAGAAFVADTVAELVCWIGTRHDGRKPPVIASTRG